REPTYLVARTGELLDGSVCERAPAEGRHHTQTSGSSSRRTPYMEIQIRDAAAGDAEALAGLIGQLGYPTSPQAAGQRLAHLQASEADRVVVAELGGEVV